MKYFNPSYWFKLWILSAPLFNDKTKGINAKSIDNQNIKDWASKNTTNISFLENQELSLSNNETIQLQNNENIKSIKKIETDHFYENFLKTQGWSRDTQIAQQQLQEIQEEHHQFLKEQHKRIKKQLTPNPRPSKEIFKLNEKLIINQNNPSEYRNSFQQILQELANNNILNIVFDDSNNRNWGENSRIFTLNTESNYGYFRLPVAIRWQQNTQSIENNLELVLRIDNLYLQGFIVNNYYYHFDFRNINMNMQPQAVRDNSIPLLREIQGTRRRELHGISPDYRDMIHENDENIYWSSIFGSFFQLINRINENFNEQGILIEGPLGNLARSLGQVILVTAEAMRFPSIYARIITHLTNPHDDDEQYITLGLNQNNEIYSILSSWGRSSRDATFNWLLQIANTIQNTPNMMISAPSIWDFTMQVGQVTVQVVLGYIEFQRIRNIGRNANCRRRKRDITNKFWHEKFCDLKPQIDKIQGKITAIKILDENTEGGHLKSGDIYIGTDNGVYLIHGDNRVDKFEGLNFPIKDIILDGKGSAYVINEQCEIYHLNLVGWGSEKLENMESCDLNKEINIYYSNDKKDKIIYNDWGIRTYSNLIYKNFNLNKISPFNYKKIDFLGSQKNFEESRMSWGNDPYRTNLRLNNYNGFKVYDKIIEYKTLNNDDVKLENCIFSIQRWKETYTSFSNVEWYIFFGITAYEEFHNWKLQILSIQFAKRHGGGDNGGIFTGIGSGIRLYNDDNTLETQILNPNDRKRRDIISNTTKWNNDFTKSINNEQHLPIDNKPNFVTNNITSL